MKLTKKGRKNHFFVYLSYFKLDPFAKKTTKPDGSVVYSGFCVELLQRLAGNLKFSFDIHESLDGQYGQEKNGQWNGMIRELIDGVRTNEMRKLKSTSTGTSLKSG